MDTGAKPGSRRRARSAARLAGTPISSIPRSPLVDGWLSALEARHLADFTVPEVTRALRALSSAYVQRRRTVARGATLDTAGKRAAFALFYAPLHFITTTHVVEALGATGDMPRAPHRHWLRHRHGGRGLVARRGRRAKDHRHRSPSVGRRRSAMDVPAASPSR
jgi:hypothetical protein